MTEQNDVDMMMFMCYFFSLCCFFTKAEEKVSSYEKRRLKEKAVELVDTHTDTAHILIKMIITIILNCLLHCNDDDDPDHACQFQRARAIQPDGWLDKGKDRSSSTAAGS